MLKRKGLCSPNELLAGSQPISLTASDLLKSPPENPQMVGYLSRP
jgi:hypothetical protein